MFYCAMKGTDRLLYISAATFLPNIVKIGQRTTSDLVIAIGQILTDVRGDSCSICSELALPSDNSDASIIVYCIFYDGA